VFIEVLVTDFALKSLHDYPRAAIPALGAGRAVSSSVQHGNVEERSWSKEALLIFTKRSRVRSYDV
jgi:hypothetical protein